MLKRVYVAISLMAITLLLTGCQYFGFSFPTEGTGANPRGVVYSVATQLDLRTAPSYNDGEYTVIDGLHNGDEVEILGVDGLFYKVRHDGQTGYSTARYIQTEYPLGVVFNVVTCLNLRRSASSNEADVVGSINNGQIIEITGLSENGYKQIRYDQEFYWVTAQYVRQVDALTTEPPTEKVSSTEPATEKVPATEPVTEVVETTESAGTWVYLSHAETDSYRTATDNSMHNLQLAALNLEGLVIQPNEEFSWIAVMGACTQEKGYRIARIIVGDGYEDGYGGGVCQISTTINWAIMNAGIPTIRVPHGIPSLYVPDPMYEATVSAPAGVDFKFTNTMSKPIRLVFETEGSYCRCEVQIFTMNN